MPRIVVPSNITKLRTDGKGNEKGSQKIARNIETLKSSIKLISVMTMS